MAKCLNLISGHLMALGQRIYVLSTGRAGTKFLSSIFERLDAGVTLTHQSSGSRRLNIICNILFQGKFRVSRHRIERLFKICKGTPIPASTADPLLSIPISLYLKSNERLKELDWRIVHLVRDPRSVVSSFMNWKSQRRRRILLHHLVPFWQPSPILDAQYSLFRFLCMSKFEHFCWTWNLKNRYFKDAFEYSGRYLLVKMEDLVLADGQGKAFGNILEFIGMPMTNGVFSELARKKVNTSLLKSFPDWQHWSGKQARILDWHCGALMKKLGYGEESRWQELVSSGNNTN